MAPTSRAIIHVTSIVSGRNYIFAVILTQLLTSRLCPDLCQVWELGWSCVGLCACDVLMRMCTHGLSLKTPHVFHHHSCPVTKCLPSHLLVSAQNHYLCCPKNYQHPSLSPVSDYGALDPCSDREQRIVPM